MEKIKKHVLILFVFIFFNSLSFSQTRLGLHFTQEELNIWRQRAVSGPYKTKGDVAPNTPGDWDRIVAAKNKFMSNPSAGRWTGSTATGCVQPFAANDPNKALVGNMQDAAFYALVKEDDAIKRAVKTEILAQIKVPGVDFYNTSRWCKNVIKDLNPIFDIAIWGNQILYTYEFVEDIFSDSEKQAVQYWLTGLAIYLQGDVDASLIKIFKNRGARLEDYVYTGNYSVINQTSANGHNNIAPALYYNNRRAHMVQFFGLVGIKYKNEGFISDAKNYFKETLAFMCYPDGIFGELERVDGMPSRGLNYLTNTFGCMIMLADALARTGDFSLYDFKTTHGIGETKGTTEKSLQWAITQHGKYLDGSRRVFKRGGKIGNETDEIDGTHPEINWTMMNDAPNFAIANIYYNNSFNKSIYMRTAPGIYPYPASGLATNGSMIAWKGLVGHTAGLFMYAQMEGKVWPYPNSNPSEPPANKMPLVTAGPDRTLILPENSVTLSATASDSDGSIASYSWTKVTGGTVVMAGEKQSKATFSDLTEGTYTFQITVTDNAGATATSKVNVYVKPKVTANSSPIVSIGSDLTITLPINKVSLKATAKDNDGSITSYKWAKIAGGTAILAGDNQSQLIISGLLEGTYTFQVTVTDNLGATSSAKVNVNVKPIVVATLVVNVVTTKQVCSEENDGTAEAMVSGGTGPYTYKWSNGETTKKIISLAPGSYSVTVTDAQQKSTSSTNAVSKANPIVVTAKVVNESNNSKGQIDLSVQGGVPNYSYQWSNGAKSQDIKNLVAGNYAVVIYDVKGCSVKKTFTIAKDAPIENPPVDPIDTTIVPIDTTVAPIDTIIVPIDTTVVPVDTTKAPGGEKPADIAYHPHKIFSPNNDNLGDETWIIDNVDLIQGCKLMVMNESGKVVYETTSYNNNWDGTINGARAPEGGYFYVINCPDSKKDDSIGSLRLVR